MPLFWLALAFAAGITISSFLALPWWVWAIFCLTGAIPFLLRRFHLPVRLQTALVWLTHEFRGSMLSPLAVVLVILLGGLRAELARPHFNPQDLAYSNGGGFARITGTVDLPPSPGSARTSLRLSATSLQLGDAAAAIPVRGKFLTYASTGSTWQYGDQVRVSGYLETPPDEADFSYRDYLARQGIYSWVQYGSLEKLASGRGNPILAAIFSLRAHAMELLFQFFPAPESSLLVGILLGEDGFIPDDLMQAYKDTGTAHIIAISGFNIAILAGLFAALFGRLLGPRWGTLAAILAIGGYTLMVGAQGSVVRAAIMGSLSLLAVQLGRKQVGYNTLGLAALAMFFVNPNWLADVGFQLSFMATLGLVTFAERFQTGVEALAARMLPGRIPQRALDLLAEFVLFTLAAQLTTWPVQVYYFRQFSLVSLIANPLILPPQPLVMVLGGLSVLGGMLFLPLGQLLAAVTWPFVAYTNQVAGFLSGLGIQSISTGPVNPLMIATYYAGLFGLVLSAGQLRDRLKAVAPMAALVGLAALTALAWRSATLQADTRLHLSLLPGEGNPALLIQSPGGQSILVNGGSSAPSLARSLGERLLPFQHHIDGLVLTRTTRNDLGALPETLRLYPPELGLWMVDPYGSSLSQAVQAGMVETGSNPQVAQAGMSLDLGDEVRLAMLGELGGMPSGLLLSWKDFRALLPLGKPDQLPVDLKGISVLVLDSTNLKAAEAETWQAVLSPQVLVYAGLTGAAPAWAVDARNYRGLKISTDGKQMWVKGEK